MPGARAVAVLLIVGVTAVTGQAATARRTVKAAPGTYVVGRGDNLTRIARAHGTTVAALAELNGIKDIHHVRVGATLRLGPASAPPAPVAAPARPAPKPTPPGKPVKLSAGERRKLPARLVADPKRVSLLPVFDAAAREHDVPADLLKAMTWNESGWQNDKVSVTNAIGIGQLMPDTIAFLNDQLLVAPLDPNHADQNIRMSARYLGWLLGRSRGDARVALASYYQGPSSVRRLGWYEDTKDYVSVIEALRPRFR